MIFYDVFRDFPSWLSELRQDLYVGGYNGWVVLQIGDPQRQLLESGNSWLLDVWFLALVDERGSKLIIVLLVITCWSYYCFPGICILFILRWSQHVRFGEKSESKGQSRAGRLKVASLVIYVGVCHSKRWACREPLLLLSKVKRLSNHIVYQSLSLEGLFGFHGFQSCANKSNSIRYMFDCSCSIWLHGDMSKNDDIKSSWHWCFFLYRYACRKNMHHFHHSSHSFNLPKM